ncbi:MAG: TRAP transporter small permease [Roseovarius sp.]
MRILKSLSAAIARAEIALGAVLGVAIMGLILLNVVTRTLGAALFWVDETAVTVMVWMAFLGASVAVHHRSSVSVTLLPDALRGGSLNALRLAVDLIVLGFFVALLILCWTWYDPLTLVRVGFDLNAFTNATFNFVYKEVSATLGIPKFWLWLIVPIFAVNGTIHALANLVQPVVEEPGPARPEVS